MRRLAIVAVLVLVVMLAIRWYRAPERVIRRQLLAGVEAFESEDLLGTLRIFSRGYEDDWGNTYESLAANVSEVHEVFDDLEVALEPGEVEVGESTARLALEMVVFGSAEGERGTIIGSLPDPVSMVVLWRLEPQGWRITSVDDLDIPELRDELEERRR